MERFLSKILDASKKSFIFRALQHGDRGERLATLEMMRTICDLSNLDSSQLDIQVKKEAWDQIKGGKMRIELHG